MQALKKIVVLYHANCKDGFGGAWVAWKKLNNKASYVPVEHGFPPPRGLKGKTVYMIDFTYPESETKTILREAARVISIDHHISCKKVSENMPNHLFSLDHSGAVLAWNYFYPKKPVPLILRHIEDIDLWKFSMPRSEQILGFMRSVPYDFKYWDKLIRDFEDPKRRISYLKDGAVILRYDNGTVRSLISKGCMAVFEKKRAFVVNSPMLNSEIGAAIIKRGYQIAIIWTVASGRIKVSLRSGDKIDVSKLAGKYGGGGHHRAAGFELPLNKKLPWEVVKIRPVRLWRTKQV